MRSKFSTPRGFSLVETLVGVLLLVMVGAGIYGGFAAIAKGATLARVKNGALALANERLEIVRGMDYGEVGIKNGLPAGVIPHVETVDRGVVFEVTTTVRAIDLPFDGTIGGTPNDTAPADQKLVEVSVTCGVCGDSPLVLSTRVSPRALEISSGNGALFVRVVDSTGLPVEGADVRVENVQSATTTVVEDVTGVDGWLHLVDVPPGVMAYAVEVGKEGYSSAQTYAVGDPENPVPDVPHANVATGTVTQLSFAIDRLATLDVSTYKTNCEPVGVTFDLIGEKTVGLDTPKYDELHVTDSSGAMAALELEWDAYTLALVGGSRYVSGANPALPLALLPEAQAALSLVTAIANPNALLVAVSDSVGQPVAGATVEVTVGGNGQTKETGLGSSVQTDWSGGPGQADAGEGATTFWGGDGQIDYAGTPGSVYLSRVGQNYVASGYLESSTFDTGTTTNFVAVGWLPESQPAGTAAEFQVASSASSSPAAWSFAGPDGTTGTYYATPGAAIDAAHDGDRYVRYRARLSTANPAASPTISDAWVTYTIECAPAGQAYFSGLGSGAASVHVTKPGYQTADATAPSWTGWSSIAVTLTPQ